MNLKNRQKKGYDYYLHAYVHCQYLRPLAKFSFIYRIYLKKNKYFNHYDYIQLCHLSSQNKYLENISSCSPI